MPCNLHCLFPHMQHTLLVMLGTEILIFDVEFGQPLGSIPLPKGYKPFKKLLGVYGHSTSYGAGLTGGTDSIYALHEVRPIYTEPSIRRDMASVAGWHVHIVESGVGLFNVFDGYQYQTGTQTFARHVRFSVKYHDLLWLHLAK